MSAELSDKTTWELVRAINYEYGDQTNINRARIKERREKRDKITATLKRLVDLHHDAGSSGYAKTSFASFDVNKKFSTKPVTSSMGLAGDLVLTGQIDLARTNKRVSRDYKILVKYGSSEPVTAFSIKQEFYRDEDKSFTDTGGILGSNPFTDEQYDRMLEIVGFMEAQLDLQSQQVTSVA